VYFATLKKTGQPVAFKIIDLDSLNDVGVYSKMDQSASHLLSDIIREIAILKKCRHENVIELKTAFVHKSNICLIMEYFEGGTLQDILKQPHFKHGLRDEDLIACILKQILKGLNYCHNNDILHRDLKASNVLINKEGVCKLADFAFSGELTEGGEKKRVRHTFVGSSHWMAPEVMAQAGVGYNQSADIWSFGITALELANGRTPTEDFSELKIYLQTIEGPSPSLNEDLFKNYTKSFKDLIAPCLEKDPKKRPSAAQLLKHPFFKKTRLKGKDYIKEKLMSSVPEKKGKSVSSDDPLRSIDDDKPSSLEWDFDRDKFLAEKNKDSGSQTGTAPSTPRSAAPAAIQRTTSPKPDGGTSDTGSVKSQFSAALVDGQNETGSILSMDQEDLLTFEEEKLAEEQALREKESTATGELDEVRSISAPEEQSESAKSPTKATGTPFQTSPQQQDTIEQRSSRASSRASLPEKVKPEVEKHGRFEMSTIKKKKPKKGNGTKAKTSAGVNITTANSGVGSTANPTSSIAPGATAEGDKKVKRPFEISDVTDPSEIPGHASKKGKQKPTIDTLERKVNMLMKKMDHYHKNLLDIREICKANHEMIQHFYNHTLSTSIVSHQQQPQSQQQVRSPSEGSTVAPPQPSVLMTLQQFDQQMQYTFHRQRQLELENAQLKRDLEDYRTVQTSATTSPKRITQAVGNTNANSQATSGANTSNNTSTTNGAGVHDNGSTHSSLSGASLSSIVTNAPGTADHGKNVPSVPSPQLPNTANNNQGATGGGPSGTGGGGGATQTSASAGTSSSTENASNKNTPSRNSTDSRGSAASKLAGSASESLDQLVFEQLNRGNPPSLKKSTLNEIRRSSSQMFMQHNAQTSPTNASGSNTSSGSAPPSQSDNNK